MKDYEKLGVFYLGRHYDQANRQPQSDLVLYESKHLVTHGLVVGMTGSGKTGLCVDLIEEAALDAIPAIVIDPKGDLSNLLLTFPDLRPEDFAPWVNEEEAKKKGLSLEGFAAEQAELWKKGLADWRQDGERIRRLRAAADFVIYTPGSNAGLSVSLLNSFAVPPLAILENAELLRERVASSISGLLQLVGVDADPVKSKESIFLAQLVQTAWGQGRDLDLAGLIHEVQHPSVTRIGVLDVESFYPSPERFELALQLNNLLASPNFAAWMEGDPLDVGRFLFTKEGKPRIAVFSIAHLGDSERMFFVTMLLNQVLGWMRMQSGTTALRALVYMDEIFGYFPPVANPPSKQPLLTLLKQARAFGIGIVLATQNPVDLDYKGLANIGTWFIGRLQTDRDKARLLDGLEGASASRGQRFDRAGMEQILAGLASRIFLLHNVHEEGFEIFETRWAMSYLRGPLSRTQIKTLMDPRRQESAATEPGPVAAPTPKAAAASAAPATHKTRPVLPPQVPQVVVPARAAPAGKGTLVYQPRILAAAHVRFTHAKTQTDKLEELVLLTEIAEGAVAVDWEQAKQMALDVNDLENTAEAGEFADCPPAASQVKNYAKWTKDLTVWIYNNRRLALYKSAGLKLTSSANEDERTFRIRLHQVAHEQRNQISAKLRKKYAPKITALQERLRKAQAATQKETGQAESATMSTVAAIGSTLLGAFLGKKPLSSGTVGRAATSVRSASRAKEQFDDIGRAKETVAALQQQLNNLDAEFHAEVAAATGALDPSTEALEVIEIRPTKANIHVHLLALAWVPFQRNEGGVVKAAY